MVDTVGPINGADSKSVSNKPVRVAIVDSFTEKSIFIDGDSKPDIPHGNASKRIIEEGLPKARIETFDTKGADIVPDYNDSVDEQLGNVVNKVRNGEKYDYLNFSIATREPYSALSASMGQNVTPENVYWFKPALKNKVMSVPPNGDHDLYAIKKSIEKLDELTASGVKVYIAAGDSDDGNTFNLYTLANGVHIVGGSSGDGKVSKFSVWNSSITDWASGDCLIRKVKNSDGKVLGYDYTGDGSIDFKATNPNRNTSDSSFCGTSFSCPRAIVKDASKNI